MTSFILAICDLKIRVESLTERAYLYCRKYVAEEGPVDFTVRLTKDLVGEESEELALLRLLAERFLDYGIILFHSSLMSVNGLGYAYTALSGTGKSTHTALLRKVYPDRVKVVNDDKPFVKVTDHGIYAYGTPWCGKEHLENNICVPMHAICFLHRGEKNSVVPISALEAYPLLLQQIYRPKNPKKMELTLSYMEKMLRKLKLYNLYCNMEDEAARVSYEGTAELSFEDILNRDGVLLYKTKGCSMKPMLHENRDLVWIRKWNGEPLKRGDVVLYRYTEQSQYILHRIVKIKEDEYWILGDNCLRVEKGIRPEMILGRLEKFTHKGKDISAEALGYRFYVWIWCGFYPVRLVFKNRKQKVFSVLSKIKRKIIHE